MRTTPVAPTIDAPRPGSSRRDHATQLTADEPFDSVLERHSAPTEPSDRDRGAAPGSDRSMERRRTGRDDAPAPTTPDRSDPVVAQADTDRSDDVDATDHPEGGSERTRDEHAEADAESSPRAPEVAVRALALPLAVAADGPSQSGLDRPAADATRTTEVANTSRTGSVVALESHRPELGDTQQTDPAPAVESSDHIVPSTADPQASATSAADPARPVRTRTAVDPANGLRMLSGDRLDAPAGQVTATSQVSATDPGTPTTEVTNAPGPDRVPSVPASPVPDTAADVPADAIRSRDARTSGIRSGGARSAEVPSAPASPPDPAPEAPASGSTSAAIPPREATTPDVAAAVTTPATPITDSDPAPVSDAGIPAVDAIASDDAIDVDDDTDTTRPRSEATVADHPVADDASMSPRSATPSEGTAQPIQPGRTDRGADIVRQHAEVPERSVLAQAELRRVTANGRRVDMDITTSDLGRVRVTAVERAGGLQLQLSSDQTGGRAHLDQHLHELRADLTERGLDIGSLGIGSLDVGAGDAGANRDTAEPPATPVIPTDLTADQAIDPLTTVPAHGSVAPARNLDGLDLRL